MNIKKILPHVIAVIVFIAASFIYFSPVLHNKQLNQSDMSQYEGCSKAINDYHKATGNYSQWAPNLFSGMPAYQITEGNTNNVLSVFSTPLTLWGYNLNAGIFFLMALGFYVFMICMGCNPWLAIFSGLIYALGSYNIIIIGVGHITKAWAMAMIAPILAGMILTFKKKYLSGCALFAFSLGLQIMFNHIQITYYTMLTAFILGISYLVFAVKDKQMKDFVKSFLVLIIGVLIAVMPSSAHLMINQEYMKYTMRGGSELTIKPQNNTKQEVNNKGLDINYAYNWSYGKGETMTILIPDYKGGGSADARYETLAKNRINEFQTSKPIEQDQNKVQQIANQYIGSTYFGEQPFTAGPVYFGAIVVFLALLGFILLDNKWRWWLLAATILSVILAWGSNFMAFNSWLFYHLPLYNKFRTPSMALVIANVTLCIMAILGLKAFFDNKDERKRYKALLISGIVVGGFCLLCAIVPSMFSDFSCSKDDMFAKELGNSFIAALQEDRQNTFTSDSWRSFIFIAIAFFTLFLYNKNKIKKEVIVIAVVCLAAVIDLWGVDKRYVNDKSFQSKTDSMIVANNAENSIMQAVSSKNVAHYRVYNLTVSPFNDATTSYFFPSIGGYSAAKLQRYQDIIDFYLANPSYKQKDITDTSLLMKNQLRQMFYQYRNNSNIPTPNFGVLNMLDTKYIVVSNDNYIENTEACGAAWFVKDIHWTKDANEEILALDNFNPKKTVVINNSFKNIVHSPSTVDSTAKIEIVPQPNNNPEYLVYKTSSKTDQIAVFSEIYYGKAWQAYIDGKEVPHFCANYILRGLYIPQGNHTIEFRCSAPTLAKGKVLGLIGSILMIVLIVGAIGYPIYKNKKQGVKPQIKQQEKNRPKSKK